MQSISGKTISIRDDKKILLVSRPSEIKRIKPEFVRKYINALVKEYTYISTKKIQSLKDIIEKRNNNLELVKENRAILIYALHKNQVVGKILAIRHHGNFDHVVSFEMSVAKEFRRKRLGFTLINECIRLIKKKFIGVNTVEINVYANNKIGLKVYDKYGFLEIAKVPNSFQWQPPGRILEYKDKIILRYYL